MDVADESQKGAAALLKEKLAMLRPRPGPMAGRYAYVFLQIGDSFMPSDDILERPDTLSWRSCGKHGTVEGYQVIRRCVGLYSPPATEAKPDYSKLPPPVQEILENIEKASYELDSVTRQLIDPGEVEGVVDTNCLLALGKNVSAICYLVGRYNEANR